MNLKMRNKEISVISIRIYIFILINCLGSEGYWNKLSSKPNFCNNQNKLLSLLNLLCNATQTTSVQTRDACYGCFFRAGSLPGGATQLTSLSQCATTYLLNTDFATCAVNLALMANGSRPTTAPTVLSCYTGYCEFVRCVRRINSNRLITQCFTENQVSRNFSVAADQIYFFTNLTSCVLARTRCNAYNPISGELQNQLPYQYDPGSYAGGSSIYTQSTYVFNSLQITSTGDIRIISFPASVGVADLFCSRVTTLEQSTYREAIC